MTAVIQYLADGRGWSQVGVGPDAVAATSRHMSIVEAHFMADRAKTAFGAPVALAHAREPMSLSSVW